MYSIVMMAALTSAPDAPQFNGYFRDLFNGGCNGCSGCNGCCGGVRYSCYGGGCSGAVAYPASCNGCSGCNGCCGGGFLGFGLGERVRSLFDRGSGCCGSYGCGCSGASYSCNGYSCNGSAYSCFGGQPYGGGMFPASPPAFDSFPPYPGQPNIPYATPEPAPSGFGLRPAAHAAPAPAVASGPTGRASVVVKLPVDARLSADNRVLNLTGAERKFVSPELPLNQEFVYRFKVEYERDGETVSVTKKVPVRAGSTLTVEFADLTAAKPAAPGAARTTSATTPAPVAPVPAPVVAPEPVKTAEPPLREPAPTAPGDRATITVKLPPGATLYVDDRKSPSRDAVRQFATPPLPANREFAYLIKAEIVRDGQPETLTQKVPFRAGERVVVDFTSLGGK